MTACRATYLTGGLESLRVLSDKSIDFVWSQAVLEHFRRGEFADYCREMARVLRPGGVCSHRIDLKDHLGGSLNNLRFQDAIWESKFMATSGFYTNRIRYSEMLQAFKDAGFRVEVQNVDRWSELPIARKKLSPPFREMPVEELLVKGFDVVLRHA
jgi:SAM-dependent methyltransferase